MSTQLGILIYFYIHIYIYFFYYLFFSEPRTPALCSCCIFVVFWTVQMPKEGNLHLHLVILQTLLSKFSFPKSKVDIINMFWNHHRLVIKHFSKMKFPIEDIWLCPVNVGAHWILVVHVYFFLSTLRVKLYYKIIW